MFVEINSENFDREISSGLKVVEFYTTWCGYCKKQEEILKEMDKIWIGQVDGDKSPDLIKKYAINGYPSFLVFNDGNVVDRFSGVHSKFDIMNILMQYMKK